MIFYQGTTSLNLFPKPKSNIVSLVPSISWYLYELIDSNSIVGISKFCEIPENCKFNSNSNWRNKKSTTSTHQTNQTRSYRCKPRKENTKDAIEDLAKEFDVYTTDVNDLHFNVSNDAGTRDALRTIFRCR